MQHTEHQTPTLWLPVGGAFSLLILIAAGFGALLATNHAPAELLLGLAVTFGVGALLLMLFLMAIGFSRLHLDDKTQALGLPSGSVRALIALLLIVIWVIVSIFLFTFIGGLYPNIKVSQDGITFALAFYATMSTLVSALAAFYFGSSSTKTTRTQEKPAAPEISKIFPPQGPAGEPITITLMGKNFHPHATVSLRGDAHEPIHATILNSTETTIICTITFPTAGIHSGDRWDVVVVNADGASSGQSGKGVFTIK
ncbi:MAG TPA: IPT/TIG domain-containing protein [Ktedonobacteraceae bacterium]|jgi:hypothetical protein